jgi:hypothetical protein
MRTPSLPAAAAASAAAGCQCWRRRRRRRRLSISMSNEPRRGSGPAGQARPELLATAPGVRATKRQA